MRRYFTNISEEPRQTSNAANRLAWLSEVPAPSMSVGASAPPTTNGHIVSNTSSTQSAASSAALNRPPDRTTMWAIPASASAVSTAFTSTPPSAGRTKMVCANRASLSRGLPDGVVMSHRSMGCAKNGRSGGNRPSAEQTTCVGCDGLPSDTRSLTRSGPRSQLCPYARKVPALKSTASARATSESRWSRSSSLPSSNAFRAASAILPSIVVAATSTVRGRCSPAMRERY
jgi:hypothetical protein